METATLATVLGLYVEPCCTDLFAEYGLSLRSTVERAGSPISGVAGVIGFTGEHLKGSLVLASTLDVIRATFPGAAAHVAHLQSGELADWMGELANQLLGRIKNRLLLHDVAIVMSTPVSITGDRLEQSRLGSPQQQRVSLTATSGPVLVCIEAEVDRAHDAIRAEPMGRADAGVAAEGELVLF